MNRLIYIIVILVALSSCNDKDKPGMPPTIGLVSDNGYVSKDTMLNLGDEYRIGLDALGVDYNLTNLIIEVSTEETEVFLDSGMNTRTMNYRKKLIKGSALWERWTYIIRDRDGQASHISQIITLDTSSVIYGSIVEYDNINLGAQDNPENSFMSLSNGNSYDMESAFNNQEIIDLCYYYDIVDTDENTISSPGGNVSELIYQGEFWPGNWGVRNTVRFKTTELTQEDFNSAQNDSLLIATYGTSDGKRKAKNMKSGDIFSFKNHEGRVGLFIVNSIEGQGNGIVNISIKVQE